MAGWHVIENYLEETSKHSTLVGKYWITMFLVLRMLVLFSIAEGAFGEDDEKLGLRPRLECDTKTPGCQRMCENQFYPIQPTMYWSLQLLFVALPIMLFIVYTNHKREKVAVSRKVKHKALEAQRKQQKEELDLLREKIENDRKILEKKKEAAEQLYENPYGQKFSANEIEEILDREEKRILEAEKELETNFENEMNDDNGDEVKALFGKVLKTQAKLTCKKGNSDFIELFR